jgi:hypothetical protein
MSFPAWLVILEFFAVNLWSAFQPNDAGSGVAFVARRRLHRRARSCRSAKASSVPSRALRFIA